MDHQNFPVPLRRRQIVYSKRGPPTLIEKSPTAEIQLSPVEQRRTRSRETTLGDRVTIRAALTAGLSTKEICKTYRFTRRQVDYAKQSLIPEKSRCGRKAAISPPKAEQFTEWITSNPGNPDMPYRPAPTIAPKINKPEHRINSIRTIFESQDHVRRSNGSNVHMNSAQHRQMQLDFILG